MFYGNKNDVETQIWFVFTEDSVLVHFNFCKVHERKTQKECTEGEDGCW